MEKDSQKERSSTNMDSEEKKKQEIILLRFNYDNLQKAVWDCHKVSWTMTGIFLPAACTAMGILVKYRSDLDKGEARFFVILIFGFIVFWFLTISFLDRRNRRRFGFLRRLEMNFNKYLKGEDYEPIFQHHLSCEQICDPGTVSKQTKDKCDIWSLIRDTTGNIKFYWLAFVFFIFLTILLVIMFFNLW